MTKTCQTCGKEFNTRPSRVGKFCSKSCAGKNPDHPLQKLNLNKEFMRQNRYKQLAAEEKIADRLRKEGYQVFSPTVVCDRVVVKDGRVFFAEFKKTGQKLREGQQTIRDLMPESYLIIYE
ncbi:MAG: hypothetical protein AB7J46_06615 [Candidatus Altimarinota bacterium]